MPGGPALCLAPTPAGAQTLCTCPQAVAALLWLQPRHLTSQRCAWLQVGGAGETGTAHTGSILAADPALPAMVTAAEASAMPFPGRHFAVFIIYSWNFEVFWTSLQTYLAAGWGKRLIIIDNSMNRRIVEDPGEALLWLSVPTNPSSMYIYTSLTCTPGYICPQHELRMMCTVLTAAGPYKCCPAAHGQM